MANALYPLYKQALLAAGANLSTGVVKAVLVNLTAADGAGNFYAYAATHEFLSDIPAAARIATSPALTTKTLNSPAPGTFDADNVTFTAVTGTNAEALVLYLETGGAGTPADDRLIAYFDTGVTGLPVTPNGGDIQVTWDDGTNRIFKL